MDDSSEGSTRCAITAEAEGVGKVAFAPAGTALTTVVTTGPPPPTVAEPKFDQVALIIAQPLVRFVGSAQQW
jgi:hypothetical protein